MHRSRVRDHLLLTLLAGVAFLPYLDRPDVITSHEARVIQVSRAMAESGWPWNATPTLVPAVRLERDDAGVMDLRPIPGAPPLQINPWLVPIMNGQIRLQKPPLPYWCTAAAYRLGGSHSELLSRLIPAALGFLSTFLIAALARRLIGRRAALIAALVWSSSYFIPDEYRKSMTDPYLAFSTLLALWSWIAAASPHRQTANGKRHSALLVLSYVSIALALLSKGYPFFPHFLIPVSLYHLLYRRRVPGRWWLHLLGIAIVIAVTVPWPLYILKYVPSATEFWRYESVGRLSDNIEQYRPWHFYVPLLLQISLPWTFIWLLGAGLPLALPKRHISRRRILFPIVWFAAVVLFFSIFKHKKLAYLLPALPAAVLMTTWALLFLFSEVRRRGHKSTAATMLGIHCILIGLFGVVPTVVTWAGPVRNSPGHATALIAMTIAALGFWMLRRRRPRQSFVLTAAAAVVAFMAFFNFYRAPIENQRSPKPAVAVLRQALRDDPDGTTLISELPPEATVYLPLHLPFDPNAKTIYLLIDDRRGKIEPTLDYAARKLPQFKVRSVSEIPIREGGNTRWNLFAFHLR